MGDRAQVAINDGKRTSVYLYTHWNGEELTNTVRRALAKRQRWDDAEYLTRIVFCEMIKGQEAEETGFGIGTSEHGDLDNPLIVLNCKTKTIHIDGRVQSFDLYVSKIGVN